MKTFFGSNTIRLALAAILGVWAAFFAGEVALQDAVNGSVVALLAIFLRKGAAVPIGKALLLCALVGPFMPGCVSMKVVNLEEGAIALELPFAQVRKGLDEEGVSYEMILPDGTYVTLPHGAVGNLTVAINLNDDTGQSVAASAAAAVNSPNADPTAETEQVIEDPDPDPDAKEEDPLVVPD